MLRPEDCDLETWSLLHNNAPDHTPFIIFLILIPKLSLCRRIHLIWSMRLLSISKIRMKWMFFYCMKFQTNQDTYNTNSIP